MFEFQDPELLEFRALHHLVSFTGQRVLEVGCGDGRMMRHYARAAEMVAGLDIDADELMAARRDDSDDAIQSAAFAQGRAEALPYAAASFDFVVLAWSLCCVAAADQAKALQEAARVARSAVIDIRASLEPPVTCLRPRRGDDYECGPLSRTPGDTHYNEGASGVIAEAVKAGWLSLAADNEFDWIDVYDSADELASEIADEWQSWTLDEDVSLRLLRNAERLGRGTRAYVRQGVRAQLLRKVPR